jgi:hypothetical protein
MSRASMHELAQGAASADAPLTVIVQIELVRVRSDLNGLEFAFSLVVDPESDSRKLPGTERIFAAFSGGSS